MPDSPATPSPSRRPGIARSYSAAARLSPPEQQKQQQQQQQQQQYTNNHSNHNQPQKERQRLQLQRPLSIASKLLTDRDPFQDPARTSDSSLPSSPKRHLHFHHHIIPHFHGHANSHMHGTSARLKHAGEKLQEKPLIPSFLHTSSSQQFDGKTSSSTAVSRTVTRSNEPNVSSFHPAQPLLAGRHQIGVEDVARERRRRERRDRELATTVSYLNDEAHQASRQLDHSYYLILEKCASLHSTISSLQDLYRASKELHDQFVTDTRELTDGIEQQAANFHGFEDQKGTVEKLEARVRSSKERAAELSQRLGRARDRVAAWEKREEQWQRKVGFRLRIFYGCAFALGILIVSLLVLKYWAFAKAQHKPPVEIQAKLSNVSFISIAMEILGSEASSIVQPLVTSSTSTVHEHTADPRLDMFDEL